ncbi:hypothetical protein WJX72_011838 [[Myrmecia] bisecta]|uniref:Uncharacterized protein n=1 Tax=[Myrmecia] bisecta TaxID=41462 RepID=A0AAW1QSZ7_9CHLO
MSAGGMAMREQLELVAYLTYPGRPAARSFKDYGKVDGVEAVMWRAVTGHYVDMCNDDCNADPDEWPVFSLLSPHHRMALVADIAKGLLCRGQPFPPDSIEHHAAFLALLAFLHAQIECELDDAAFDFSMLSLSEERVAKQYEDGQATCRNMMAEANIEKIKKKKAKLELKEAKTGKSKEQLLQEVAAQRYVADVPARELERMKRRMRADSKVFRAPFPGGPEPVAMVQVSPAEREHCCWRMLFHAVLVKHHGSALVLQPNSTDPDAWQHASWQHARDCLRKGS